MEQNSDRKVSKSDNDAYEDSQIVYKLRPRPKCEDSLPDFSVEYSLHRPYDKTHQVIESEEGQLNIKLNSIQSLKFEIEKKDFSLSDLVHTIVPDDRDIKINLFKYRKNLGFEKEQRYSSVMIKDKAPDVFNIIVDDLSSSFDLRGFTS